MAVQEARFSGMLNQLFKISQRGSSVRTEIIAGITTFLTMGYILFVNPSILGLGGDGLPFGQVLSVTALAAGVSVLTVTLGPRGAVYFAAPAFQRLDDGLTMIAESGPGRIIEVDKDGKIQRAIKLKLMAKTTN